MNDNCNDLNVHARFMGFVFVISCIVFTPFYIFASGLPQPAHVAMLFAGLIILIYNWRKCSCYLIDNKFGLAYIALVLVINGFYYLWFKNIEFLVNTVYWLYGFLILMSILIIGKEPVVKRLVRACILISLVFIFLAYILGFGSYTYWPRYEYFFNGPNQLAYYAICMLLIFYSTGGVDVDKKFFAVYFLSVFIVLITGSRSAYLALIPLVILFAYNYKRSFFKAIILLVAPLIIYFAFKTLCFPVFKPGDNGNLYIGCPSVPADKAVREVVSNTANRITGIDLTNDEKTYNSVGNQLTARGYMRAIKHPEYLVYGAGQGNDARFSEVLGLNYEIHSSLFAVWFYYGALGLFLFLFFIYNLFRSKLNLLYMVPIFVYGLFTYGLRSPYFWVAVAFLSIMPPVFTVRKA